MATDDHHPDSRGLREGKTSTATTVGGGTSGSTSGNTGDSSSGDSDDDEPDRTSDRVQPPATSGFAELDCPALSDTTHRVTIGDSTSSFRANCGVNHPINKGSEDLAVIPAYSFGDCITACAAFNKLAAVKDTLCVLVHFNANLGLREANGGNCWLKTSIGEVEVNNDAKTKNDMVEGELVR